jgi:hypothetical protein
MDVSVVAYGTSLTSREKDYITPRITDIQMSSV